MKVLEEIASVQNVCDVEIIKGPGVEDGSGPDVLLEIPHGATQEPHYDEIREMLSGDLPRDLKDYFYVNTDVGSAEYGRKVASLVANPQNGAGPKELLENFVDEDLWDGVRGLRPRSVMILRCLIPRTFIDCNRVLDVGPEALREGDITASMPESIREPADAEKLVSLYNSYRETVERAYDLVCGSGGIALMPHTYAPRAVYIETFDEGIVKALRSAYEPEQYKKWDKRPAVDIISEGPDGTKLAPRSLVESVRNNFAKIGVEATENGTYRLHPATLGHRYSARYAGKVLCIEINRELLADPFTPFEEMQIGEEKVARMSAPIAAACLAEMVLA